MKLTSASKFFGISRQTLYRAHHAGKITITKVGRASLVSVQEVLAYLTGDPLPRRRT